MECSVRRSRTPSPSAIGKRQKLSQGASDNPAIEECKECANDDSPVAALTKPRQIVARLTRALQDWGGSAVGAPSAGGDLTTQLRMVLSRIRRSSIEPGGTADAVPMLRIHRPGTEFTCAALLEDTVVTGTADEGVLEWRASDSAFLKAYPVGDEDDCDRVVDIQGPRHFFSEQPGFMPKKAAFAILLQDGTIRAFMRDTGTWAGWALEGFSSIAFAQRLDANSLLVWDRVTRKVTVICWDGCQGMYDRLIQSDDTTVPRPVNAVGYKDRVYFMAEDDGVYEFCIDDECVYHRGEVSSPSYAALYNAWSKHLLTIKNGDRVDIHARSGEKDRFYDPDNGLRGYPSAVLQQLPTGHIVCIRRSGEVVVLGEARDTRVYASWHLPPSTRPPHRRILGLLHDGSILTQSTNNELLGWRLLDHPGMRENVFCPQHRFTTAQSPCMQEKGKRMLMEPKAVLLHVLQHPGNPATEYMDPCIMALSSLAPETRERLIKALQTLA